MCDLGFRNSLAAAGACRRHLAGLHSLTEASFNTRTAANSVCVLPEDLAPIAFIGDLNKRSPLPGSFQSSSSLSSQFLIAFIGGYEPLGKSAAGDNFGGLSNQLIAAAFFEQAGLLNLASVEFRRQRDVDQDLIDRVLFRSPPERFITESPPGPERICLTGFD